MLEVTPAAVAALARSLEAARRFRPDVVIRVALARGGVEAQLAEQPESGDRSLEEPPGVYAAPDVFGVLDVADEHERLVLRSVDQGSV